MDRPSARRPLPALAFLLALSLLTALVWWRVIHEERRKLELEPARLRQKDYDELLTGAWGDQRKAESFLLLPMKMFNRVTGSLALTSMHLHAYEPEEIQVLETMVQIITVSIENAKLYERSRQTLREAKQREEGMPNTAH